jgi:spermidine synthase
MNIFNLLKTQVLFEKESPYNGTVSVLRILGTTKLRTDGVTQSANYASFFAKSGYWSKAADIIKTHMPGAKRILFLGLGGGTSIHYIARYLPNAKLYCVEIDPIVIEACTKYFDLAKIANLEVITGDAFIFIENPQTFNVQPKFDVVFADTFRGGYFVPIPDLEKYLTQLKGITTEKGLVLFNYTFKKTEKEQAETFLAKIKQVFGNIQHEVLNGAAETDNYLIYAFA